MCSSGCFRGWNYKPLSTLVEDQDSPFITLFNELQADISTWKEEIREFQKGFLSCSEFLALKSLSTFPLSGLNLGADLANLMFRLFGETRLALIFKLSLSVIITKFWRVHCTFSHPTKKLISTIPYTDVFGLEKLLKFSKVFLNLIKMYPDNRSRILNVVMLHT